MIDQVVARAGAPLVVVAAPEEAEHLDSQWPVLLTGIGRLNAATMLTRELSLMEGRPSVILNVGTAGALTDISGVHRVARVELHDFSHSSVRKMAGFDAYPPIELGGEGIRLATGDTFVESSEQVSALARTAEMVDMEGYALAFVAKQFDIPIELIKVVSDSADEKAGAMWVESVTECSKVLAKHLSDY